MQKITNILTKYGKEAMVVTIGPGSIHYPPGGRGFYTFVRIGRNVNFTEPADEFEEKQSWRQQEACTAHALLIERWSR